ncbi:MAG: HlyD family efflux transporter periplasmic adaptor subunit [Myxococcota bacterium]|nr:HlyD family efflux transporter periplasmic adaptor subunit [Myxococcota bacterium]
MKSRGLKSERPKRARSNSGSASGKAPAPSPADGADGPLAEGATAHRTVQDGSGVDYFVHRPPGAGADAPLFVAIHHNSRDAEAQLRAFSALADRYGAVLVAPRFASERYPDYQRLGRDRSRQARGRGADAALNAIVDEVTALLGGEPRPVHLFGYASGGRFAIRYAMAHPERVAGVVAASAGSYTLPDPGLRFPLGIGPRPGRSDLQFRPERLLRVPITVFEARSGLRSAEPRPGQEAEPGAGLPPERDARTWVAAMRAAASQEGLKSAVSYREVQGSAQSFRQHVERGALAERVFEALFGAAAPARPRDAPEDADPPVVPAPNAALAAPSAAGGRRPRRILMGSLGALAGVAVLAPLLLWAHYRATHVVSRDAVVRGHIADVGSRMDGVIHSIEVDTGDHVATGEVIARLQDAHFEARVRQARSQLEKATRELEVERLAIANERVRLASALREVSARSSAAQAEVGAAQSLAQEAQRRMELQRSLASRGLVAEERARTAETEHRTALARVAASAAERTAAEAARELARVESEGLAVREKRISVLEAEIAAFRAELAVAEADLEGAVIRAPDDGAVVRRIVEPGGAIVVGEPVVSLWIGEELWVEAWIDEDELGELGIGSEATVTLNSYPDREFRGVVETIGVSTDYELPDSEVPQPRHERMRDTPVIGVRIRLQETDAELFPGLSAVVGIRKKGG